MPFWGGSKHDDDHDVWKAEVCNLPDSPDGDMRWKNFQEWQAIYEPRKQDGKKTAAQAAQDAVAKRAKVAMLDQMQKGISSKITTMLQETISRVLTKTEAALRDPSSAARLAGKVPGSGDTNRKNDPSSAPVVIPPALIRAVNSVNAIALTYRFEKVDPRKFTYLRRLASDSMTDALRESYEAIPDGTDQALSTHRQLHDIYEAGRAEATEAVSSLIDKILEDAGEKMNDQIQEELAKAEATLVQKGTAGEVLLEAYGVDRVEVDAHMARTGKKVDIHDELLDRKDALRDEMLDAFGQVLKGFILSRMDKLTVVLAKSIDSLLEKVNAMHMEHRKRVDVQQDELREQVYRFVEEQHAALQKRVTAEVQRAIAVLGAMSGDADGSS